MTEVDRSILDARTIVLVEGVSDQLAVETLAERCGRDLAAERVRVLPMGGATNIGHFLNRFGRPGSDIRLAGLCDEAEAGVFRRGLERAGIGSGADRCRPGVEGLLHLRSRPGGRTHSGPWHLGRRAASSMTEGDLTSFRTFQQQPAQRGRSDQARLRRFMGTRGGRKIHYAPLLVRALDPARVPRPLQEPDATHLTSDARGDRTRPTRVARLVQVKVRGWPNTPSTRKPLRAPGN